MLAETETMTPETEAVESVETPLGFKKEAPADDRIAQRKPPSRGMCRRCGLDKPINRLMLCYPCWVKTELEDSGWREGMPHPDWCACSGVEGHERKSDGN